VSTASRASPALSSVIGHWVRNVRLGHVSPDEAWNAVRDYNIAQIRPPWEEARLRREFDAIARRDAENHGPPRQEHDAPTETLAAPQSSDDAIAATFVAAEGEDWRYVPSWSKWLTWQGTHWAIDETNLIRERVRQACRDATRELAEKPAEARRIASNKTISAVVAIAGADPAVSCAPDAWDQHPMLLNTPSGTIDLEPESAAVTIAVKPSRRSRARRSVGSAIAGASSWNRSRTETTTCRDTCSGCRILPDGQDRRAGLRLPPWLRRQRKIGLPEHARSCSVHVYRNGGTGHLHQIEIRSSPHRTGRSSRGEARSRVRNRGRPVLGRGADKDHHGRGAHPRYTIRRPERSCNSNSPENRMTTHDPIPARLAALKTATTPELKAQWRDLFDSEPPPFNRRYLESRLAYRIQELAYGGLKPETIRRLERLGEELDGGDRKKSRVRADTACPSPARG
jgi:hypothetical protein